MEVTYCPECGTEFAYLGGGPLDIECINPTCKWFTERRLEEWTERNKELAKDPISDDEFEDLFPIKDKAEADDNRDTDPGFPGFLFNPFGNRKP